MLTHERTRTWQVRDLLESMVRTLDRERPDWREAREPESPAPGDDREVVRRLASGVMRLRFEGEEPLHLHPELLASASDSELDALTDVVVAPGGRNGAMRALRKLRRVSRALCDAVRGNGVPFALQLREAFDHGEGRPCVAVLCETDTVREQARVLRALAPPVERSTAGERFLARLDVLDETEAAEDIRRASRILEAFATGADAICGADPDCGICDLRARGFCSITSRCQR